MAEAFLIGGFLLAVIGVGLWSVPAACIVAGVVMFIAGGREMARR